MKTIRGALGVDPSKMRRQPRPMPGRTGQRPMMAQRMKQIPNQMQPMPNQMPNQTNPYAQQMPQMQQLQPIPGQMPSSGEQALLQNQMSMQQMPGQMFGQQMNPYAQQMTSMSGQRQLSGSVGQGISPGGDYNILHVGGASAPYKFGSNEVPQQVPGHQQMPRVADMTAQQRNPNYIQGR